MRDVTADFVDTTVRTQNNDRKLDTESVALDCRYGQIGISAVAAAARYQGSAKNPAYAPASSKWRDRIAADAA